MTTATAPRFLELQVRFHDGTARSVHVERNDPTGRREMGKKADEWFVRPHVATLTVLKVDRTWATGKGRWR